MKSRGARRALGLLARLTVFATFYGFVVINWLDLHAHGIPAYHLLLAILYFTPFATVLVLRGLEDWELTVSMGLYTSLMNDLFYYPAGRLLFGIRVDLAEWYRFQLGLEGGVVRWVADFGALHVPVSSILMGLSIYARIALVALLAYKWLREEESWSASAALLATLRAPGTVLPVNREWQEETSNR